MNFRRLIKYFISFAIKQYGYTILTIVQPSLQQRQLSTCTIQLVIADLSKKYKWITKIYVLFLTNSHNMHLFKCHSENPSRHNSFEDLMGDRPLSDSEAGTSMFLLSEVCYIKQK